MAKSTQILAEIDPLEDYASVDLGDKRRDARQLQILGALLCQPDRSVPQVHPKEAACEGYYRFLRNPNIEDEALLAPHFAATAERSEKLKRVLCHHDTTKLSFPLHDDEVRENLARRSKNRQGFLWHASLVTSADGLRAGLGLIETKAFVHKSELPDAKSEAFWETRGELYDNEKWRWYDSVKAAEQRLSEVAVVTHVFDREFDDFQMLFCMHVDQYDYVARACYDRKGRLRSILRRLKPAVATRNCSIEAPTRCYARWPSTLWSPTICWCFAIWAAMPISCRPRLRSMQCSFKYSPHFCPNT